MPYTKKGQGPKENQKAKGCGVFGLLLSKSFNERGKKISNREKGGGANEVKRENLERTQFEAAGGETRR